MKDIKRAPMYCIEATYKGETGYVTKSTGGLVGITPAESENIAMYADRATAEVDAEHIRALQADADPWDALTGVKVIEHKSGA